MTTEYTDPISIQFFFAPPREPAESNTNVTRIYNSILVQRHEWFFLLLLLFVVYTNAHRDPKYAFDRRPSRETRA